MNLYDKEKNKYEFIHTRNKRYGHSPVRVSWIKNMHDEYMKNMHVRLKKCKKVLEVGFGKGTNIDALKIIHPHIEFIGIDISKESVSSRKDLQVFECSAHDLNIFNENEFDAIIHFDGMEHIPSEWQKQTINEYIRICNGWQFHSIHTGKSIEDKIMLDNGLEPLHINLKSNPDWQKFFKSFNVNIEFVEVKGVKVNYIIKNENNNITDK